MPQNDDKLTNCIRYKELPGTLWCVTPYFNPMGYANRYNNFLIFYRRLISQTKNVLVVELAQKEDKLTLQNVVDKNKLVQIVDYGVLWQKERLINIGIDRLPEDCDKVCWIDCDVLFEENDWWEKTADALTKYMVVQPFLYMVNLPKGIVDISGVSVSNFPIYFGDNARAYSYIFSILHPSQDLGNGHPGYVWAARRELLTKHGLYDRNICGGGDWMISRAAAYNQYTCDILGRYSKYHIADYYKWAQPFCEDVDSSCSYIQTNAFHLYHGMLENRLYDERMGMMKNGLYDPSQDIELKDSGMWTFTRRGIRFLQPVRDYFALRKEDV